MRFRIKEKKSQKWVAQVRRNCLDRWRQIDTKDHLFKNYSGVGSKINAKQNLYEFASTLPKYKNKGFSMNSIGEENEFVMHVF